MAQRPMTSSGRDDDPPALSRTVFPGLGKFMFTDVSPTMRRARRVYQSLTKTMTFDEF